MKNDMPNCNYCKGQSEWMIVYGKSPENQYTFCCSEHIGKVVSDMKNKPHLFYAEHFTCNNKYDENWSKRWSDKFNETKPVTRL